MKAKNKKIRRAILYGMGLSSGYHGIMMPVEVRNKMATDAVKDFKKALKALKETNHEKKDR